LNSRIEGADSGNECQEFRHESQLMPQIAGYLLRPISQKGDQFVLLSESTD